MFPVNFSHPLAEQQIDAVEKVLAELDVSEIPKLMVWNKVMEIFFISKILRIETCIMNNLTLFLTAYCTCDFYNLYILNTSA